MATGTVNTRLSSFGDSKENDKCFVKHTVKDSFLSGGIEVSIESNVFIIAFHGEVEKECVCVNPENTTPAFRWDPSPSISVCNANPGNTDGSLDGFTYIFYVPATGTCPNVNGSCEGTSKETFGEVRIEIPLTKKQMKKGICDIYSNSELEEHITKELRKRKGFLQRKMNCPKKKTDRTSTNPSFNILET
jgi:hypothetical protein